MTQFIYSMCGLTVRSELEIPGIPQGDSRYNPSVEIRFGNVPESLDNAQVSGAAFDANPGELLLQAPPARFWVRDGREIIIQPESHASLSDVRVFLMGSAFGALLHQRQILPLHASCIRVGNSAVAFTGNSGAGKSTLAAWLRKRGYPVLGDDICPVRIMPGMGAVATPGFPRLKLWAEALDSLGIDSANCDQPRQHIGKYELAIEPQSTADFLPLKRLYVLQETRDSDRDPQGIVPVEGIGRIRVLLNQTYRFRYVKGFGQQSEHLQLAGSILQSVSIFRFWRYRDLNRIDEGLDELESHLADLRETAASTSSERAA